MTLRRLIRTSCGVLAAVALFAIMVLTFVDVVGRKFLSGSVPGSLELTELLMVVVIFTSLPLVAFSGEHVLFDSLDRWLPPWLQRAQVLLMEGVCALSLGGLAWLMWDLGAQMRSYGDTTAQLKLPLGVFVCVMAVLLALAAAAHVLVMLGGTGDGEATDQPGAGAT